MIVTIRPTDSASDDPALVGRHGYQILPEASSFGKPVELTIAYKSEAIPSGAQESSLALAYLSDQGWTIVSGSSVDTGSKTVTAAITRFAAYAVLATSVVGAVEISPPAVQVAAGDTARLYASILNGQGNLLNGSTHWSSSDTSVASVDATGLVLGRSPGSAEIHVSSGGREARASISVLAGRGTDAHPILFGVHQDLTWDGSPDRRKAAIAAAQMIGARISRSSLLWHLIEPRQGQRDWSRVDSVLAELDRAGVAPLFVVYGSPAWANGVADTVPDHWAYVPTGDSAFQRCSPLTPTSFGPRPIATAVGFTIGRCGTNPTCTISGDRPPTQPGTRAGIIRPTTPFGPKIRPPRSRWAVYKSMLRRRAGHQWTDLPGISVRAQAGAGRRRRTSVPGAIAGSGHRQGLREQLHRYPTHPRGDARPRTGEPPRMGDRMGLVHRQSQRGPTGGIRRRLHGDAHSSVPVCHARHIFLDYDRPPTYYYGLFDPTSRPSQPQRASNKPWRVAEQPSTCSIVRSLQPRQLSSLGPSLSPTSPGGRPRACW